MATFSKLKFSGSTNGRQVAVASTSSPGTTIHAAHATAQDEVYIYATNLDSVTRTLTIYLGGTSDSDKIIAGIPAQSGHVLVVPGVPLTGSVTISASASVANKINISGWVNRITP